MIPASAPFHPSTFVARNGGGEVGDALATGAAMVAATVGEGVATEDELDAVGVADTLLLPLAPAEGRIELLFVDCADAGDPSASSRTSRASKACRLLRRAMVLTVVQRWSWPELMRRRWRPERNPAS